MRVAMIIRGQSGVPGAAGVPGGQIGMAHLSMALVKLGMDVELVVSGGQTDYLPAPVAVTATYLPDPSEAATRGAVTRGDDPAVDPPPRLWVDAVRSLSCLDRADVVHVQGL